MTNAGVLQNYYLHCRLWTLDCCKGYQELEKQLHSHLLSQPSHLQTNAPFLPLCPTQAEIELLIWWTKCTVYRLHQGRPIKKAFCLMVYAETAANKKYLLAYKRNIKRLHMPQGGLRDGSHLARGAGLSCNKNVINWSLEEQHPSKRPDSGELGRVEGKVFHSSSWAAKLQWSWKSLLNHDLEAPEIFCGLSLQSAALGCLKVWSFKFCLFFFFPNHCKLFQIFNIC